MLVGREGTGFIKTITALIAFPFCPLILKRKRRNVYDRCCANSNGAGNEGRREEYTDWVYLIFSLFKVMLLLKHACIYCKTASKLNKPLIYKHMWHRELASEKTRVGWCHCAGTVQLAPKARLMACTRETHPPQHKNCTTVTSKQHGGNECWLEKPPSPGKWLS